MARIEALHIFQMSQDLLETVLMNGIYIFITQEKCICFANRGPKSIVIISEKYNLNINIIHMVDI